MNVSNKVSIPAIAGAITTVGLWALTTFVNITPPPEVAAALTVIIMTGLGYVVPHGGDSA